MKRLILTITIVLVLIGISADVVNAQINWRYIAQSEMIRNTSRGRLPRIGGSMMGGSQVNWRYIAQSEMIRNSSGYSRMGVNIGGYDTNVRVKSNESWNLQGGQRSYEQSPDYLGKVIDSATTLGALEILSH